MIVEEPSKAVGIWFPDLSSCFSGRDTLDETIAKASEVLSFAAEGWEALTGSPSPSPRTLDALRADAAFLSDSADAVVAAIPFDPGALRPAAE